MQLSAQVNKVENMGKMLAYADLIIDGEITIKGFRVLDGQNGPWVAPPSQKKGEKYEDTVRYSKEMKQQIQDTVMAAYNGVAPAASKGGAKSSSITAEQRSQVSMDWED